MSGTSLAYAPAVLLNAELKELFFLKYGDPATTGWSPRRNYEFGYYWPADHYEALVSKLVTPDTDWIDVGGGSALFPHNAALSDRLARRARHLVVVDPSDNIAVNPFPHHRAKCLIEDYETDQQFDLATLRMVAEHITNPPAVARKLNQLVRRGGRVVIFTVNRWSPVTLVANALPFGLHYPIKKMFWGGEEEDTFPTAYKMNTRRQLRELMSGHGFDEEYFAYLDDLSVLGNFKRLNYLELRAWQALNMVGLRYPENCLLGMYQKR